MSEIHQLKTEHSERDDDVDFGVTLESLKSVGLRTLQKRSASQEKSYIIASGIFSNHFMRV